MKIDISKNLNMFGKYKNYIASFGAWTEEGKTKEEAKENLENAINWYMQESDFMPIIKNAYTRIVILNRNFYGYSIVAIEKESAKECYSYYGRSTKNEALKALESMVNNYLH
jgi:predicted RNase H-like HicB family nuclease